MYERILVTLDGSELSEAAIPVAKQLAGGTHAKVRVMTVADPPQTRLKRVERTDVVPQPGVYGTVIKPEFEEAEPREDLEQRISSDWHDYLRRAASPLIEDRLDVTPVVKFGDDAAESIVGFAQDWDADAIVMATHGRSGISQAVFGSVARDVLKSGVAPLVLAKAEE